MKKHITIICTLTALNNLLLGFDASLKLPSFEDLKKASESVQKTIDVLDKGDNKSSGFENIVVSFDDDKKVPKITSSDQVSVDFINEDIKSVLRYISELYDLNIIIPTALNGSVTLRLKNVNWQDLLTAVLTPVGCSYTESNGIVRICSEETIKKEPLITKTFLLKFADAKTVADELKDFIDKENKEKLTFNTRTNILIWTGLAKNEQNIEEIVNKLDKPETQVMIEAKFVEVSNNLSDNRGIKWPTGLEAFLDESGATNAETTTTEGGKTTKSNDDTHGQLSIGLNSSKALGDKNLFVKTLTGSFDFTKTDSIGKTLSNPTIITMNNVPASMSVSTNYPIPNYSYNSDKGIFEISGFEEKPVGLELKVTPKVQAEYITLQLEPSLSNKTADVTFNAQSGTSVKYPQINYKKASSVVTIKSGYTIAIGGLMSQTKNDTLTKTPFLGDIPFVGSIFSHKAKVDELTNLMIFLSATQIAYDGTILYPHQTGAKNISDKRMFEMGITGKDLPGELPITDEEKAIYNQIQTLQNKLDNLMETKKAIDSKKNLTKSVRKQSLPVAKEPAKLKRMKKVHYPLVKPTVEPKKNRKDKNIIKQEKQLQSQLNRLNQEKNRLEQKRTAVEKQYNDILVKKAATD